MLGLPLGGDLREQLPPAGDHRPPCRRQSLVGEADRPQLPEDADVPGTQVLAEVGARRQPLLGERPGPREHVALPLQQPGVLAGEDCGEQLLLAAEVVVDERGLDAGHLGDSPRRRRRVPVLGQHLSRRVEDLGTRVLAAGAAQVDVGDGP